MQNAIIVRGARLHNLKNITVAIPKQRFVVLTGLSGSGKSTLGLDILNEEGRRQYLEALGLVSFGVSRPPVDSIRGLSPAVTVDQRLTNHSPRSTVGTITGVYTYLRVLFAKLGRRPCPHCGEELSPFFAGEDPEPAAQAEEDASPEDTASETFPCPHCAQPVAILTMAHFSFNKPEGACPTCTGLGTTLAVDLARLLDESKSIPDGAIRGWDANYTAYYGGTLQTAAAYYGIPFDLHQPLGEYTPAARDLLLYGTADERFARHFPGVPPPATVRAGRFEGVTTNLLRRYAERVEDPAYRARLEEQMVVGVCPDCGGTRLRRASLAVTLDGKNIVALAEMCLHDLAVWLRALAAAFTHDEGRVAAQALADLHSRIAHLVEVGAGYLAPGRGATSLSAGEAQRLRLAGLLGSGLSGILYVFDEPTIGLHPRDTQRMIGVLRALRDLDNTVLVIEHDLELIAAADHVIDFGPGAGKHGGEIVAQGTPAEVAAAVGSPTGDYLAGRAAIPLPASRRTPGAHALTVHGATAHNLQDLTVRFPLGLLVAVTGVSGSGKSTLVFDILDRALRRRFFGAKEPPGAHGGIDGVELLDKVITIDQEHAGRIPRSNAATYADIFTPIRELFAKTAEARARGLTARHFSFNVPGGRCERCEGAGTLAVQMQFLPAVEVRCPACHGRRFLPHVLGVRYHDHDIAQVLDLTVAEALALFSDVPAAASRLRVLADVGLGYLQLGQPATTLSGGEAQRIKLAKELGRRATGRTLYLLDEPTTGLHPADTARLLGVLNRLVDAGNSVIVVEHNLELIKTADWVIDLGPEGGSGGGRLLAEGTPEQIAATPTSFTGQALRRSARTGIASSGGPS